MNITIVYNSLLPALRYGGTQRVVWGLAKSLSDMGHSLTLLVRPGSSCPFARVIPIDPGVPLNRQIPPDTDITHFEDVVPDDCLHLPHVVTVNGNRLHGDPDPCAIFVSKNHAARFGSKSYVYNGLLWDDYGRPDLSLPRRHYHFLGKAAWRVKNVRGAIAIVGRLPGGELDVLGGTRLNFKMGFRLTLNPRIHFFGMVDNAKKKEVIQRSRGLIFPVTWDEPFGLAVIESLYFGAPVFASARGSLPELVNAQVGYLSNDMDDLAAHIPDFDCRPQWCHDYVREQFSAAVMARGYLGKYEQVLNGLPLNA